MSAPLMSATIGALAGALAKAQAIMAGAKRDATNPHYKNKYADLAAVWEACRAALTANNLAVVQAFQQAGPDGICVVTTLMHSSGEWITSELYVPVTKRDAQGFGSAITYARRYALAAMVGVAPEDDDASAAVGTPRPANGPIKPPAANDSGAHLSPMEEAKRIGAAMGLAASVGAVKELGARVKAISDALTPEILDELRKTGESRIAELRRGSAA